MLNAVSATWAILRRPPPLLRHAWGYGGHILDLTPGPPRGLKNGVNDKNNYFSKNMIVKTIYIQVISVYESIFVRNIIHITFY